jgi:pSer/pThr/pTyr-binding forkhead associated (FHA) protein
MPAHLIAEDGPLRGLIFDLIEGDEWIVGRDPKEADLVVEGFEMSRKHARITRGLGGYFVENLSHSHPVEINNAIIKEPVLLHEGDVIRIGETLFRFTLTKTTHPSKKTKGGYEDIFSDLETPELPPAPEPVEEIAEEKPHEAEEITVHPAEQEIAKTAYDTIFEDGAEPEIPFNLLAESPLILKVTGGPNAGAEIGLEKGRTYTIGKDQNSCDIIFQDLSVSRNHARLAVTPEGILELEDLGSKNGTLVNQFRWGRRSS